MIKAVFFDFDQTLFSHKTKSIPKSAIKAIEILHKKNILCALATGRHLLELEMFEEVFNIGLDGFVTIDGQICLDKNKKIISSNSFSQESLNSLLSIFSQKDIALVLVEESKMYINVPRITSEAEKGILLKHELGSYSNNPIYLAVAYVKENEISYLEERLPDCSFLRWSDSGVDILPKGRDKVSGIHEFLKFHNIDEHSYMAFGDGENDKGMLCDAEISVAMGSASESVKKCATYVSDDVDNDGLYKALEHFGLLVL